jgi:hypothetical protein
MLFYKFSGIVKIKNNKKLSKICQKFVKKLLKSCQKLTKSFQKTFKKLSKMSKKCKEQEPNSSVTSCNGAKERQRHD